MVVTQLRILVECLDSKVKQQENSLRDSAVNLVKIESLKARTLKKRKEAEDSVSGFMQETIPLVPRSVQKGRYIRKEELGYGIRDILGDEIVNGRIAVKYVDEVKGIEFDRVYVVGNRMSRNEKYIAYTRALSNLVAVVDNEIQGMDNDMVGRRSAAV